MLVTFDLNIFYYLILAFFFFFCNSILFSTFTVYAQRLTSEVTTKSSCQKLAQMELISPLLKCLDINPVQKVFTLFGDSI